MDYRLGEVSGDEVLGRMTDWRAQGLHGFNLTAPHKAAGASWVDRLDPVAARVGVVNTVVCGPTETVGYNTDVQGFAETLGDPPDRVVILGAGGAIRAVVVALLERGVRRIELVNRSEERARLLADALAPDHISIHSLDAIDRRLVGTELVINGLPAAANAWVVTQPFEVMAPHGRVMDLGYGQRVEPVRRAVTVAGRHYQDGIEMLARQGVAAFTLWTGRTPPLSTVLDALSSEVVD